MIKTTVRVDGMSCGMCESHVNEAVRKAFSVKRVTSSRKKGRTEILSAEPLNPEQLRAVITETGYAVGDIDSVPYEKKGFSLFG
ncbi:MAG: heavy-metal-associated domain-containing protein [Oscillibacter sp.]|nr:heavy-metal-associated domain-containing protein [Oscillibacter sp.]